jgi:hypothetical protein
MENSEVKATEIIIFKDYVQFQTGWNGLGEPRPSIDGLPLSEFADLTRRWSKYAAYLLRSQKIRMRVSHDHDGQFEDYCDLRFNAKDDGTASDDTSISITCHQAYADDYDYVRMVQAKYFRPARQRECKFKIFRAALRRKEGNAGAWFRDELIRLKKLLDDLDQATLTLRTWADSGLSMKVFCTAYSHSSSISGDQLRLYASKGLSLDDFQQNLKCKVCGGRCSGLLVP